MFLPFHLYISGFLTDLMDIGSGGSYHTTCMTKCGLTVETIDIAKKRKPKYLGDYNTYKFPGQFDGIWCSHTLEHQPNPNTFLKKIHGDLEEGGWLAITVPPAKNTIVSGHVTMWNAGLLLYHLILAGFDCSEAMVKTYDYNVSVVVKKKTITDMPKLTMHSGDIERLSKYFPFDAEQGFNGEIDELNWG